MFNNIDSLSKERVQSAGWEVSVPVISGSSLIKDVNITRST